MADPDEDELAAAIEEMAYWLTRNAGRRDMEVGGTFNAVMMHMTRPGPQERVTQALKDGWTRAFNELTHKETT